MLTLQTLRDKGGVLLAVLIGIALLAFLLGDMLSSGSVLFGSGNKVGRIEGQSINYQDYQIKLDHYSNVFDMIYGSSADVNDRAAESAWDGLVREGVFIPQLENLGLNTSKTESNEMISVASPSPVVMQMFSDPTTGFFAADAYSNFLETVSYDATGARMNLLSYLKDESDFVSATAKLAGILRGGYYPTQADVAANMSNLSKKRNIRFIFKKIRSVSDSVINFGDNDVKKYYEAHKNSFRTEDNRTVNYVTFYVNPSQADFLQAQKTVDQMAAEFDASATPKIYADANSSEKNLSRYYSRGQLDAPLAEYAFSKAEGIYGPVLDGNTYRMAKVVKVREVPDSIELSHIALSEDKKELADSLMDVMRDSDFAALAMQFSEDPQTAQVGGSIGTIDPALLGEEIFDKIIDLPRGKVVKIEIGNSIQLFKVDRKIGGQPKAFLAMLTYQVEPSKATRNQVFNRATRFATEAAGGVENFKKAGSDSVMDVRIANVAPADRGIDGVANSREVVTWAFAKGESEGTSGVMEVGETRDMFLVAALANVKERGYSPLEDVREDIVYALKTELKAEQLRKEMAGNASLDEAAQKLGLEIYEAQDVDFHTYSFPEVGFSSSFAGGLVFVKPGTLSNPIVTNDAVFLAEVVSESDVETSGADQIRETMKAEADQSAFQEAYIEAYMKAEVKDQRYKLYR